MKHRRTITVAACCVLAGLIAWDRYDAATWDDTLFETERASIPWDCGCAPSQPHTCGYAGEANAGFWSWLTTGHWRKYDQPRERTITWGERA